MNNEERLLKVVEFYNKYSMRFKNIKIFIASHPATILSTDINEKETSYLYLNEKYDIMGKILIICKSFIIENKNNDILDSVYNFLIEKQKSGHKLLFLYSIQELENNQIKVKFNLYPYIYE